MQKRGNCFRYFEIEDLLPEAIKQAKTLSRLGANRKVYGGMKDRLFGKSPPNNTTAQRTC